MKKTALALTLLATTLGVAQPLGGRVFQYSVNSDVNGPYYGTTNIIYFHMPTVAYVNPYLYVQGFMQAIWSIDGWGSGTHQGSTTITIYHNEMLAIDFQNFGDLTKVPGSGPSGPLTNLNIPMQYRAIAFTSAHLPMAIGLPVFANGVTFNNAWNAFSWALPLETGGMMTIELDRRITVFPDHGPGTYVNPGELILIRF
ncbi:MAG: hypothetical protein KIS66_03850 [Fimbriimonadaceae bacterium]|nr:hypothetical protein [Fimbriimonadaceae bacterium]